jgi:hypothetical protein
MCNVQPAFRLENINELGHMTQLADFYCVLPVVSATLSGALLGSPIFKFKIAKADKNYHVPFNIAAPLLIFEARKLRHPVLFRANPHLPLCVRQATAHVTHNRFAHPRFTSTSPILTGLLIPQFYFGIRSTTIASVSV